MQLSPDWLQQYVNALYNAVPRQVQVQPKAKGRLAVQVDELWPFVNSKGQQQWVWLALDVVTRLSVASSATGAGLQLLLYSQHQPDSLPIQLVLPKAGS